MRKSAPCGLAGACPARGQTEKRHRLPQSASENNRCCAMPEQSKRQVGSDDIRQSSVVLPANRGFWTFNNELFSFVLLFVLDRAEQA